LRPSVAAGLCPSCLIKGAFEGSDVAESSGPAAACSAEERIGQDHFGRYRIVRPLGEGGMGVVYLAEQLEPIRRSVALKVIKLGMDTDEVLARFANERQALAIMDHPNIARIFDAGASRRGRPYLVMEYIEGEPITQYCDEKRLSLTHRLELFLTVCRAVQHAHRKGVIHRDLKPSNVLVLDQDRVAVPKVIDFGIAKATDRWAVDSTLLTQFGQMVGTPEYASPEQADALVGSVDQRSDVYSLGVLLYELLSGTVPFGATRLRQAGFADMLRIIRDEEVPSLSRRIVDMGDAVVDIASRRQTDPASLRRLVTGDLTWITAKAQEKARDRRYATVDELAADVQRHLEPVPVSVSPPSRLYRARKFLRRHGLAFRPADPANTRPAAPSYAPAFPTPTHRVTVVLADFTNTTGDPAFDGALRQIAAVELRKSSFLTVLSDSQVSQTLLLMVRRLDTTLTPEVASEICERTGSAAVVEGSIARLGGQYVLTLCVRQSRTGEMLHEEQALTNRQDDVFAALSGMANRFETRASGLLPHGEQEPSLPANVTRSSLEAWRSYSAAMRQFQATAQSAETRSLLKRAIEADPGFAMAHATLGRAHADLGEVERGAEDVVRAYELRNAVSDWEHYYITFNYHRQLTRNLELCRQTLESWARKYPKDVLVHGLLSGFTSPGTGRFEKAVEEGLKAIELDPNFAIGYENVAFAYLYLNRPLDAESLLGKASERKINIVQFALIRYFAAFLRNDLGAMERIATERRLTLEAQGSFEQQEASTLASRGRVREANRLSARAVSLAKQAGLAGRAAMFQGAAAVWNAWFGNHQDARTYAMTALASFRSRDADYGPAVALALSGDTARAREIADELTRQYPDDTSVQFGYLPTLRSIDALNQNDPTAALDATQVAIPYDLAVPGTAYFTGASFFGALYPTYVRGLAFARRGSPRDAAAAFERMLSHPGIVLSDSVGPMARLGLARALAAAGAQTTAAAVYKELLTLWKHADDDLPVVRQARSESVV
jgi:serine/threonine protein kinase/tetratricopeptide (TPR) repeat protein